jgi:protein-S-isoprenylcysteine O-methyltransferase Ste14
VIRNLALAVPLAGLGLAAGWRRPDRRTRGAVLLGFLAAAVGIAGLNAVAGPLGWWTFAPVEAAHLGVPVDLWLGWAIVWGALPVLLPVPVLSTLLALGWFDLLVLPELAPLVHLGPQWTVGEAVGLVLVAAPTVALGRWTARGRHPRARATLQLLVFTGIAGWLVPATAIDLGDGSWRALLDRPGWQLSLLAQLAGLIALPGLLAVREFVERGHGTPYPWDPPERLVRTGPYAYVANPMQLSAVGLLLLIGAVTHSWAVTGAAVTAVAFSVAVAGPHERDDLSSRHGAAWQAYRRAVRPWWPRWRPYVPEPAELFLADTCDVCSSVAVALRSRRPGGLMLRAAESSPVPLRRARYRGSDGYTCDGVAAVARGLEHASLGWAAIGWLLRLPPLDRLVQVIVDGVGGGPRTVTGGGEGAAWPTRGRS